MTIRFRFPFRHPFFRGIRPIPATCASGPAVALYGAYAGLKQAAARGATVERAVFVLLGPDSPAFGLAQRDELWRLYQTPIFAVLMGPDGRIIGFECEAQSGFHVAERARADAEIVCDCGRPGRLLQMEPGAALQGSQSLAPAEA